MDLQRLLRPRSARGRAAAPPYPLGSANRVGPKKTAQVSHGNEESTNLQVRPTDGQSVSPDDALAERSSPSRGDAPAVPAREPSFHQGGAGHIPRTSGRSFDGR